MHRPQIKILTNILDDNEDFIVVLKDFFNEIEHPDCNFHTDPNEMLKLIDNNVAAICLIDFRLTFGKTGIDIINEVRKKQPVFSYFIVMSAELTEQLVIDCVNIAGCNKIIRKDNPDFIKLLIQYLNEGIAMATDLFEKYSLIWERFQETERLFAKSEII